MSNAREVDIANAVIAELNDAARPWHGACTAGFGFLPIEDQITLASLQARVIVLTLASEKISRTARKLTYGVGIDLAKWLDPQAGSIDDACAALGLIAQQIFDFFGDGHRLATATNWQALDSSRDDLYDIDRLYSQSVWETFIGVVIIGSV